MFPLSLIFFCSGFAALIYELLWMRQLGLIFGNTVHAAAAVLTAYMLGLAIGAKLAGKWAERLEKPVKAFGLLEAGIGIYALIMPALFYFLRMVYKFAFQNISDDLGFLTFVRFVLAVLTLLIPTALMGATLPVLSKGLLVRKRTFGATLGVLYGLNTLGAATGILVCGFVLIPRYGLTATNSIAVCVNLSVCICAIVLARLLDQRQEDKTAFEEDQSTVAETPDGGGVRWLMFGVLLSGAFALALEVIWFRALILIFGLTTYSFAVMLAVFLLGIALGSVLLSWISDRVRQPVFIFMAAQLGIAFYTLWSMRLFNFMPEILLRTLSLHAFSWESMLFSKFLISVIFLLPVTVLFGVSFTAVARGLRNSRHSASRTVGDVYTFNTIGGAIGSCLAAFVLLPKCGIATSMLVVSVAIFAMVVILTIRAWGHIWYRSALSVLGILGIAVALINPPRWDPQVLSAGPYFNPASSVENGVLVFRKKLDAERLLYFSEGTTALISIVRSLDENLYISSDGKVEADTTPKGMVIQRMMAHLPMLLHPNPRSAINLGLGAGVTLGALSCYPLAHLEVVEIEPATIEAARIWGPWNHSVMDDPRLIITINDGRNHFFATTNRYDVITSDPIEPVVGAAANLYALEHFQYIRDRLNPGGIMSQFLPLYELSRDDVRMILRSFHHVFPESVLFFTGVDTIIVGFRDEVVLNMTYVREKFTIPAVRESLIEFGFTTPQSILGMFVADLRISSDLTSGGPLNTDRIPRIEYSAPKSALHYTVDLNQQVLLDLYSEIPSEALSWLSDKEAEVARRSQQALQMVLEASQHRSGGNHRLNIEMLMEAAMISPENAIIINDLVSSLEASALSHEQAGRFEQAGIQYDLVLKYNALSFTSLSKMVHYSMQQSQSTKAREYLKRGLQAYPDSPIFTFLRAKYRATSGDIEGALGDIETAIEQLPRFVDFWDTYQLMLNLAGRPQAALEAGARARALRRGEI